MRDSYKKFWKTALVEKMGYALPIFELKETPSLPLTARNVPIIPREWKSDFAAKAIRLDAAGDKNSPVRSGQAVCHFAVRMDLGG